MSVLVLNCGSSSVKYQVVPAGPSGMVERIGEPSAPSHESALRQIMSTVDVSTVTAVGHRVVHGGSQFSAPTVIDDDVVRTIRDLVPLAPLHNPANLAGIEVARRLLPDVPQVAVFDTAFHQTMPPAAYTYAIPGRLGIRRYGFHGTSHAYVSKRVAGLLARDVATVNTISLHLGNGASACAISGGRSVATSMGLSPMEGLVMGTRSGDIDPGALVHLLRQGVAPDELDALLNHGSGLLGLCGSNDMRTVLTRRGEGDADASLAFDVYCARVRSYVGSYAFLLGRVDAIVFTAGVGQNAVEVRAESLSGLASFGITVDPGRNASGPPSRIISPDGAPVAVCVVPTDEEQEIAAQTLALVQGGAPC